MSSEMAAHLVSPVPVCQSVCLFVCLRSPADSLGRRQAIGLGDLGGPHTVCGQAKAELLASRARSLAFSLVMFDWSREWAVHLSASNARQRRSSVSVSSGWRAKGAPTNQHFPTSASAAPPPPRARRPEGVPEAGPKVGPVRGQFASTSDCVWRASWVAQPRVVQQLFNWPRETRDKVGQSICGPSRCMWAATVPRAPCGVCLVESASPVLSSAVQQRLAAARPFFLVPSNSIAASPRPPLPPGPPLPNGNPKTLDTCSSLLAAGGPHTNMQFGAHPKPPQVLHSRPLFSLCPSVHLSVCSSVYFSVCLSVLPSVYPSSRLSARPRPSTRCPLCSPSSRPIDASSHAPSSMFQFGAARLDQERALETGVLA